MSTQPVALITGAGRRLGLHMTKSLLNRGWRVVVFTREYRGDLAAIDSTALTCIEVDASDDDSVTKGIDYIKFEYDALDLIIHNASVYEADDKHAHDQLAFYDLLYQVHMKLPARLNHELGPLLAKSTSQHGNLIHITDIYVDNPNADYALYCSTKAASENLMKSFAKRLAPRVRVNAIQPGPVKFLPEHSSAEQDQVLSETLLAVEGGFEALEKAIYAILDNHYMTGSVIRVDGGRSLA
ncbi:SDR family oxidoreductase [Aliidiomarina sp. Khilg15.8]